MSAVIIWSARRDYEAGMWPGCETFGLFKSEQAAKTHCEQHIGFLARKHGYEVITPHSEWEPSMLRPGVQQMWHGSDIYSVTSCEVSE